MTLFALTLVLISAFVHATWNFLAKQVGGGGGFIWLVSLVSTCLYAPVALTVLWWQAPSIGWLELTFMFGSALIHALYFLCLQRGYRVGDFSVVYPLARGTGPLLSTLSAVFIFGERPSLIAFLGALLVVVGVFIISGGARLIGTGGLRHGVSYGLVTGVLISIYTLWDKYAVSSLHVPPLVFESVSMFGRMTLLSPLAWLQRREVVKAWQTHRQSVFLIALLTPLSYILVLTAMVTTPVSYVAPARELSILLGALMGARLLGEGETRRRMFAAAVMVIGVVALALG